MSSKINLNYFFAVSMFVFRAPLPMIEMLPSWHHRLLYPDSQFRYRLNQKSILTNMKWCSGRLGEIKFWAAYRDLDMEYAHDDHLPRSRISMPFPDGIVAIIAGFTGFEIFPTTIFKSYFGNMEVSYHRDLIVVYDEKQYMQLSPEFTEITTEKISYLYDGQVTIFGGDTKLPQEVIEKFDPRNEFGLRRKFESVIAP